MAAKSHLLRTAGFSLIEILVAILVLAIAMVGLTTLLYPQVDDSARSHYEVRATALGQSLMTEILSRGYDNNSDADGGIYRCGESGGAPCSATLGPDSSDYNSSGDLEPGNFNDVDDYIGCWYTNAASEAFCTEKKAGNLTDVLGNNISVQYPNFAANVKVIAEIIESGQFKRVTVSITAGDYGTYSFTALKGNF